MKPAVFSVIIPARNTAATLPLCLEAIFSQSPNPSEVIVVNDGSSDATRETALRFPCRVIDVHIAGGAMKPRFEGARHASSELLVFIDADVVVPAGTFERIARRFEDGSLSALTGRLTRSSRVSGFFTRYKNEYMHYIFGRRAGETDFLYGSIFAVRARDLVPFIPLSKPFTDVADSELGFQLALRGKRIMLDPDLEVEHLKHYSFTSLVRNDFVIPFMFMRLLLTRREAAVRNGGRRFSHAALSQVLAAAAAFSGSFSLAAWLLGAGPVPALLALALAVFFYAVWAPFLKRCFSSGPVFAVNAFFFTWLDAVVMFSGMLAGFVYHQVNRGPEGRTVTGLEAAP